MSKTLTVLICLGSVLGVHMLPSFEWDMNRQSASGVPLLNIRLPSGDEDQAILHIVNPIPQLENEKEEDVDNCIFSGYLKNEPEVVVTVAGCAYNDNLEIALNTARLEGNIFLVENGIVRKIESPFHGTRDQVFPDVKQQAVRNPSNRAALPSSGFILRIKVAYDQLFKNKCLADSVTPVNAARKVMAFAQDIFRWASLTTTVRFNIVTVDELDFPITGGATGLNLESLQKYNKDPSINANVYLSFRGNQGGAVGLAYIGGVCTEPIWRTGIAEYLLTDANTGRIMAHEMGHMLGMNHDFGEQKEVRLDSKGKPCGNIGGLMDYGQKEYLRFSTCSVEDFTKDFNKYEPYCLALDDGTLSTFQPTPSTTTTTTTTTRPLVDPCLTENAESCFTYCAKFEDKSTAVCTPPGLGGVQCKCTLYS